MSEAYKNCFSWVILGIAVLISGGGWILIPSQVKALPLEFTIGYRFSLTSFVLMMVVKLRKEKLFDKKILEPVFTS